MMISGIRSLDEHVAELLAFCERACGPLPSFEKLLFLDTADPRVRYAHGWELEPEVLVTAATYAPHFNRLLVSGYSWINLSAYGLWRGDLIIGVEQPRQTAQVPPGRTSVNYSGPSRGRDGKANWQLQLTITRRS
jgi:hypothetical protein